MKRVRCQSGIEGYECRLQDNYDDFKSFKIWSSMYGLHKRLGFRSMKAAWQANPVIQGSVIPSDFRIVKGGTKKIRAAGERFREKLG